MEIVYTKSFWEMDLAPFADPMRAFVARVSEDGFDGTEMFLPLVEDAPSRVLELHQEYGLRSPILDIITVGETPAEHRQSFDQMVERAVAFRPPLINSHTGRDIFSFADNLQLFEHAISVSEEIEIPIVHETHRFRPTYSATETRRYLEELPELMLNADLSHWMVVHESDLTDQSDTVDLALSRSRHIHARVGFEEGPQIGDPRAVEWLHHVERHIELWLQIVTHCRRAGVSTLAITPEFGPPPYAPVDASGEPVADVWASNVYMKNLLEQRLG